MNSAYGSNKQFLLGAMVLVAGLVPATGHAFTISGQAVATTGNNGNPAITTPTVTASAPGTYTSGVVTGPEGNSSSASFTISSQPTPSLSLFATGNDGNGSSNGSYGFTTASYRYLVNVNGPVSGVAVPVDFSGNTSGTISAAGYSPLFFNRAGSLLRLDGTNIANGVADLGTTGTLPYVAAGFNSGGGILFIGWGYDAQGPVNYQNYSSSYGYQVTQNAGSSFLMTIAATAQGGLTGSITPSGTYTSGTTSVFIDPNIYIDPTWLASHPGYSIQVEAGVGNTPAVPEPSNLWLFGVGVIVTGISYRRRRQTMLI